MSLALLGAGNGGNFEFAGSLSSVSAIRAGQLFTITGTNLYYAATVTIGGVPCTSVTVVNSTTITAIAPESGLMHNEDYTLEVL